ncbi:unnamed protein product [Closterium sp. NIES-53]
MASPNVLTFDSEEYAVDFNVWWTTRDAVARFAARSHLPSAERAHFGQYKTAKSLYDAVVARYSSPATAALSRLMLPYLFPDLAAFATVADLITHLRTSDARYRTALLTEDQFLFLCPTELTVDLLEERLTAAEKSLVAVGASRGDPRAPFFEGCSLVPLLPSVASAAAVDLVGTEEVGAASAPGGRHCNSKCKGGKGGGGDGGGGGGGSGGGGGGAGGGGGGRGSGGFGGGGGGGGGSGSGGGGSGSGGGGGGGGGAGRGGAAQRGGFGGSQRQQQSRSRETPSAQQLRGWYAGRGRPGGVGPWTYVLRTGGHHRETGDLLKQNVAIFDLDFDAILAAMYAVSDSAEGDCYRCVPPDPGIEAAALGASESAAPCTSASAAPGTIESAAPGVGESALSNTAPNEALHTFTLDSSASRSFFRDTTTLTPLSQPVAVSQANPSKGPVLAHSSTVLPCPAAPSGLLSGLHLPSFSTNLVSGADLQDLWVDQFTPGGQRVTHCTCSRIGRHVATFTRRPGSSMYTQTTATPPITASGQVAASGQVFTAASKSSPMSAPCSCRPLSHETLLSHHCLGHPSLPHLRGMASCTLVSVLPRSLPRLPLGPAPTCVPCVEGRQRAAPHSSEFPPTEAPLQTLHMDVWGPARVSGQGHERYFLLVVDDYSRYTTVFPLRSKGEVTEVLSDWIRGARRQLSEIFGPDLPALRLHSDIGGEFSSDLLRAFCRAEGIRQTFTLPASPQQNGIAERRIGMVIDYAAHQINLQPRASLPETTPTLRWTGKFYHPTSCCILSSQDVTFDESVSYYRLFPYRTASIPPPPLFLAPGAPPVDPLPPQDPAPSGVSQVDPVEPVEVAVDSGTARGAESGGAEPRGAEPGGAESERAESGDPQDVPSRWEPLSPQRLRERYTRRCSRAAGATGPAAGGASGAGAAGGAAGAGAAGAFGAGGAGAGGTSAVEGPAGVGAAGGAGAAVLGGALTGGTGAAGAGGAAGVGAVGARAVATGGAAGAGAAGGNGAGGAAGVVAGDTGAEGSGVVSAVSGGTARPQPYYVPLLQQPASPLPGPSPYSGPTRGLTERREPESRPASPESRHASSESRPESPVRALRTGQRVLRQRPPPVPGTHSRTLRPSTAPQRVPLPSPLASSLPDGPDPESHTLRAASPTVTRFQATAVTDASFESTTASALVPELVDFAAACRLDYAASLVAESKSATVCPTSVGGQCTLGTDVLEHRQEDFECFATALPHLVSMLIAPEGDLDAPDIPTPRSYAEAIEGIYVDEVPPPGANIVSGMWIFKVKQPLGSPPVFKARYVARGFSQRQGVNFFLTFSPTPKMTTPRVLLYVAAQRDYELHSLDFSTAFLQGSVHDEIWLRRPPGFTGSFPAGTQWSLRRPVYGLRQAPREWHDTLRTTLAALGSAPSTADPSLFLRTDTTLPPFYGLVYVDDLVFANAETEALTHVKSELQKRHTCIDLGELTSYLGLRIIPDRAQRTITLTHSHMVQQVLQRFGFTYSSPQSTPMPTGHSLSAPPSDESVEPSGPYPELMGCLIYLMTCTRPDLAYPLSILARYVAPGRHRKEHMDAARRVLRYLCSTSGMGLVLGGRARVVLTSHADASWVDDLATQRSSEGYTFSLGSGSVSWRSTCSSSVLSSSCEADIYAGAMAAQDLRWLTYLLTDLGEVPRSSPVLYVDNKAMLALCQEHRLEHRTKHIALRYFLARELQQRGQLRLAYVATRANSADIFTKAFQPCDHQRFCTMLACFAFLDQSCDLFVRRPSSLRGSSLRDCSLRCCSLHCCEPSPPFLSSPPLFRAIPPRASSHPPFLPPRSLPHNVFVRPASPQPYFSLFYSRALSSPPPCLPISLPPLLPSCPPPSSRPLLLPASPPLLLSSSPPPRFPCPPPPVLSSAQVAAGVLDRLLPSTSLPLLSPSPSPPRVSSAQPPCISVFPMASCRWQRECWIDCCTQRSSRTRSLRSVRASLIAPPHVTASAPHPCSLHTTCLCASPSFSASHAIRNSISSLPPTHRPNPSLPPRPSPSPTPHVRSSHQVAAVVTQPPSSRGRGRSKGQLKPTAVGQLAADRGLPPDRILSPASARDPAFLEALKHLHPDVCITAAYGNFLPSSFLSIPLQGTVNIHPSLLPKFRGASPVQRALEQGVRETGVTVAYTVLQMDAGPIIAQEQVVVADDIQAPQLLNDLFRRGTHLLLQHLPAVLDGSAAASATPQDDSQATHAAKVAAEEGILDFSLPALTLHNKVRAFAPWPGTRASFVTKDPVTGDVDNVSLKLLRTRPRPAAPASSPSAPAVAPEEVEEVRLEGHAMLVPCSDGSVLEVWEVQPDSKRPMTAKQFWNGLRNRKLYRPA